MGPSGLKVEVRKKAWKKVGTKSSDELILTGAGARGWTPEQYFAIMNALKLVFCNICPGILITLCPYGVRRILRATPSAAGPLSTCNW